jgi:hypothetical protein
MLLTDRAGYIFAARLESQNGVDGQDVLDQRRNPQGRIKLMKATKQKKAPKAKLKKGAALQGVRPLKYIGETEKN